MPALDPAWSRAQFPALAQEIHGQPAVFFDGPGGTQVPQRVIDAISDYLAFSNANAHGAFATSERTDAVIAGAHAAMADLLGCDADEVAIGQNMTTLTFSLSRAIGRELRPGDEIVVTRLDHDANVAPWQALEERGIYVRMADVDVEDCTLDMADLARQINERTRLVAVGYASNAVGTINDVAEVARLAHAAGALVFVDAVHYAPHGPIDVRALDCDFLACSPYKFFGPHMGALYGKRAHMTRLRPYKVRPAPDTPPDRWETGTQNHEALAGLIAAIEYLAELGLRANDQRPTTTGQRTDTIYRVPNDQRRRTNDQQPIDASPIPDPRSPIPNPTEDSAAKIQNPKSKIQNRREALLAAMEAIRTYERGLCARLIDGLLAVPGLTLYGIGDAERFTQRTPTVAIRLAGYSPRDLSRLLGERGIFTWSGNYYALNLTERLGVESSGGMLRIGLMHYNTVEEVDRLLEALAEIAARV